MQFNVVTIFPELIENYVKVGLLGKAVLSGIVEVECRSPRDFSTDGHHSIDDTPYGGGSGMVMMPGPIVECMEAMEKEQREGSSTAHRVLMTPQGTPITQACVRGLAEKDRITVVCGRYQGVDERIRAFVDEELSLGDFVLNGGEIAAIALIEAVSRLIPGVIGNRNSFQDESHSAGLLEYPQYTRPPKFRGYEVPPVLLSGNHRQIEEWRRAQALLRTRQRRPDLFEKHELSEEDEQLLSNFDDSGESDERT